MMVTLLLLALLGLWLFATVTVVSLCVMAKQGDAAQRSVQGRRPVSRTRGSRSQARAERVPHAGSTRR